MTAAVTPPTAVPGFEHSRNPRRSRAGHSRSGGSCERSLTRDLILAGPTSNQPPPDWRSSAKLAAGRRRHDRPRKAGARCRRGDRGAAEMDRHGRRPSSRRGRSRRTHAAGAAVDGGPWGPSLPSTASRFRWRARTCTAAMAHHPPRQQPPASRAVVRIEEGLLRRLLGLATCVPRPREAGRPGTRRRRRPTSFCRWSGDEVDALLPDVFPDFVIGDESQWRRVSRRAIRRGTFKGSVAVLVLTAVAVFSQGPGLVLLLVPIVYGLNVIAYRHLGYTTGGAFSAPAGGGWAAPPTSSRFGISRPSSSARPLRPAPRRRDRRDRHRRPRRRRRAAG